MNVLENESNGQAIAQRGLLAVEVPLDAGRRVANEEGDRPSNETDSQQRGFSFVPSNPERMMISAQQRDLALRFRTAVSKTPDLDPLSDYWCAQYALIIGDDIESFLERALQVQYFREEYKIADTFECGLQCLWQFINLFEGHLLSFSYYKSDDMFVLILDTAKVDGQLLAKNQEAWFRGLYFLNQAYHCDLQAIRKGIAILVECEGYDWSKHLSLSATKKMWEEIGLPYPNHINVMKFFHSGVLMNVAASLSKRLLPSSIRDIIHMGCKSNGGRLDRVNNVPSFEVAQLRMWARLTDALQRRYGNEKAFTLENTNAGN